MDEYRKRIDNMHSITGINSYWNELQEMTAEADSLFGDLERMTAERDMWKLRYEEAQAEVQRLSQMVKY